MEAEIRKWGNSKAIIIPSEEIERFGLGIGDKIDFSITKKEEIDGFGIFKGKKLPPFKRDHKALDREF
jgi:bifunctional DNA-binding transcriptional regulator/antitoxin component of YhaV-PrlF toxin-antitoxin module